MGPKKTEAIKPDHWRTLIEDTPLNDQTWSAQVVLMEVAGSDQDRIYLNKFEVFAAEEKRFVIKNICKSETMFMINQLGGEKKVKDESLRVFEVGQAFLKEKKDIPPDIQALVVKHLILKMKEEYLFIQKQQHLVRDGMRRESATMVDKTEVRGTVCVTPPEPVEPPPPPVKGKKGEGDAVHPVDDPEECKKYNTSLRVRGEEWRDKVYVDDFPTDGPNLYVAVSGFMEPQLAGCLIKIGVPLTAIFQIRIDLTSKPIPSTLTRPTKRGQSQTDVLIDQSLAFWGDLQQLRINKHTSDDYNNTAFIVFAPPYWTTDDLSGNPDKIYDELCFLMYDIQDLTRQRRNYLENMHIINIPIEYKDMTVEHYYHHYIDDLPLECCTTYSVLDSILQAVCRKQDVSADSSRTSLSTGLTLNQEPIPSEETKVENSKKIINDVFSALNSTNSNKKSYRLTYGEESETHKDPIIINYGDFAKYHTFHLNDIHLDDIVFSMLLGMPINRLWFRQERPQDEIEAKVNFHVNVLLSCFDRTDVETAELNRLLHILACRNLYNNRSSLKKQHLASTTISDFKKLYLKRSILVEPLPKGQPLLVSSSMIDHSFPSMTKIENTSVLANAGDAEEQHVRFLFDCPDISELVSASEIANNKPNDHVIDDFEVFEDFTETCAFQVLRNAFTNFNCLDYKYCEVTDTFNLMFFNSHDNDGISREEWRSHLPTPVCLQDFFDFVLEEHYDWIQNEERLYDEKLTHETQSQCAAVNPHALQSCIEDLNVELELLIEGSLKYNKTLEAEAADEPTPDASPPLEKVAASSAPTSSFVGSKSSKKSKTPAASSSISSHHDSKTDVITPSKQFEGYDLRERRVEVFGKDGTFYSKDGTRVTSRYSFIIPMNLENIILSVVPGNGFNEFWVHRSFGDSVTPEVTDACESFRIISKDKVAFNFKKEVYRVPIPIMTSSFYDHVEQKTKENVPKTTSPAEMPVTFDTKIFHSLCVTWPNGLITETVHEDNSSTLSHIKQYYVVPVPLLDEEMRCISLNGEVIIFRNSGVIEVLRSDGTYISITKYGKRLIEEKPAEPLPAEKSTKISTKGPEKTTKSSSKTSKNISSPAISTAVPEYELFIDEFEIVETSGLRQQWIEDRSFDIEKLLIRTATDYCSGEVFSRRMDGTQILLNQDGVQIITFPNRTRIITKLIVEDLEIYPEWTEEETYFFDFMESDYNSVKSKCSMSQKSNFSNTSRMQSRQSSMSKKIEEEEKHSPIIRTDGYISVQTCYTIEHENFASITVNKANGKVTVDSPNNTSVSLNEENHYDISLDPATIATFDGKDVKIEYSGCSECDSKTTCKIKICHDEMISVSKSQQCWLNLEDSFGKKVIVNEEGAILLDYKEEQLNTCYDTSALTTASTGQVEQSEIIEADQVPTKSNSIVLHGKCKQMYSSKEMRFFILRRDLTCSELVHRAQLEQDLKACRFQPWCSTNEYDAFADHRSLISLLSTVALTETEKWIMHSQLATTPNTLKYKDLRKDCGKGFYPWMRPYERFVPKPQSMEGLAPRLPRAFILRVLEKQWKERDRNHLKGARELLRAVLKYRRIMEADSECILHAPLLDQRSESERRVNELVQALGHRVYEELKARLDLAVASNAKPDITTKPAPHKYAPEEMEPEEEDADQALAFEAERESLVREAQAEEMSPNLKRYWRRREEELKEEQFYMHLLREGSIPPYFRNVLGGAIWWEMNSTAGAAVDLAERRRMKCVCAEATATTDDGGEPFILVPLSPKSSSDDGIHEELRELLKNSRETYSEMELVQKTTDGHPKTGSGKFGRVLN